MPPLTTTDEEIETFAHVLQTAIESAKAEPLEAA
jgi:adenosylmethionine-8-amino-7-oxononanoate aminotransferase